MCLPSGTLSQVQNYFLWNLDLVISLCIKGNRNICARINHFDIITGLSGEVNLDSKGKRNQIVKLKILAQRLTNPTFFEIVGWKRIPFFQETLKIFGFDPDSAELKFEEVELPISIGNGQMNNFQLGSNFVYKSHKKTFLV